MCLELGEIYGAIYRGFLCKHFIPSSILVGEVKTLGSKPAEFKTVEMVDIED